MSRRCLLLLLAFLWTAVPAARAQLSQHVAFQGYLTDEDGDPISDESTALTFRLYDTAAGGQPLWTEEHAAVPVRNGVFSVYLGSVAGMQKVSFDQPLWLGIAVGDQSAEEIAPRTSLAAVPYALRGAEADVAHNLASDAAEIVTSNHIAPGAVDTDHLAVRAVTGSHLELDAVTTNRIRAGAVTTDRIAEAAITTDRIEPAAVTSDRIGDGAVTTDRIADGAVTALKVASEESGAGAALLADGQGGAGWGDVPGTWSEGSNALYTDQRVGIGVVQPSVGFGGLDMRGRLRIRPNATANVGNFLVRPRFAQDGSATMQVGIVADTVSTAPVAGVWMETEPDGDRTHGSIHFITGTQVSGVSFGRRISILSNGLVGVGETEPTELLDVDGNVQAREFLTVSDARLKRDVSQLEGALSTVRALRGVTFQWKEPERAAEGREVGFIAQEVLEVLPEVVRQDVQGTYKVAYAQVVPVLVEAVKKQQGQIQELQNDIAELRRLIRTSGLKASIENAQDR